MTRTHRSASSVSPSLRNSLGLAIALATCCFSSPLHAQTPPAPPAAPAAAPAAETAPAEAAAPEGRARRQNFNPAEAQTRMLSNLREQFGVKDDAEWGLISERITNVMTLRRNSLAGMGGFGGRGGGGNGGGNGGGGNRQNAAANPELEALRSAISDNLPDAEIKARIARFRDIRKQNETKLSQAQEDLRSVLTLRQEAIAIAASLIP